MPRNDSQDFHPTPGSRGATLSQLFDAIEYTVKMGLRVRMPATVVNYQAPVVGKSPALVTILPDFMSAREIDNIAELRPGETLLKQTDMLLAIGTIGPIANRPVMFLGGSGMRMSGPLEPGEGGLYVVMDRSIDDWINFGGPLDPATSELHDITHGVFIPGLRHGVNTGLVPDDAHRVGREDGTAGMSIDRATKDIAVTTDGPNATLEAAAAIKIGLGAALAAIRTGDSVNPGTPMSAWALVIETFINGLAPGTFTPANSFATTVAVPPNSGNFGASGTGSTKVTVE